MFIKKLSMNEWIFFGNAVLIFEIVCLLYCFLCVKNCIYLIKYFLISGREINPYPSLHDECNLLQIPVSGVTTSLAKLPNVLSHMQCVVSENNFLYVLGGCVSQCVHGESATNLVYRYDPRLNTWLAAANMNERRAYFYACTLSDSDTREHIYSIGGKNKEGDLCSVEKYDPRKFSEIFFIDLILYSK